MCSPSTILARLRGFTDDESLPDGYRVVVQVSDGGTMGTRNWFAVTVNVMDIEEEGIVSLRPTDSRHHCYAVAAPGERSR